MLGAQTIFMVDDNDYRLAYARESYGVIPINFEQDDDPADSIIRQTPGMRGVDAVIDARSVSRPKGSTAETVMTALKIEGSSGKALRQSIAAVRRGGIVVVPGVYAGFIHGFMFGDAFDKGLTFKMGQTHVQKYLPELLEHIEAGRLQPELIVTAAWPSKKQPWATRCSIRSGTTAARSSSCQALHPAPWAPTTYRGSQVMNGLASYFWIAVAAILLLIDLWAIVSVFKSDRSDAVKRLGPC